MQAGNVDHQTVEYVLQHLIVPLNRGRQNVSNGTKRSGVLGLYFYGGKVGPHYENASAGSRVQGPLLRVKL